MSVMDKLRSFAGARCLDTEVIRDGLTYGDARLALAEINPLRQLLTACPLNGTCPDWERTVGGLRSELATALAHGVRLRRTCADHKAEIERLRAALRGVRDNPDVETLLPGVSLSCAMHLARQPPEEDERWEHQREDRIADSGSARPPCDRCQVPGEARFSGLTLCDACADLAPDECRDPEAWAAGRCEDCLEWGGDECGLEPDGDGDDLLAVAHAEYGLLGAVLLADSMEVAKNE